MKVGWPLTQGQSAAIRADLIGDLAQATLQVASASMELNAITGNFPAGIPPPEATQMLQHACSSLRMARQGVMTAQTRLDEYVTAGIVPEDLTPRG
jgi:hypothetical protein